MQKTRWNLTLDYPDATWVGEKSQTKGCLHPHTLKASWHWAKKVTMCIAHWMPQECLHNSWGSLQLPLYEHWKEVKYTLYFQIERTKLYISSRRHKVTFLEAMLNSMANTSEESSRTCMNLKELFSRPLMLSSQAHCDHTWRQVVYTL